jgi:hypothetical protein
MIVVSFSKNGAKIIIYLLTKITNQNKLDEGRRSALKLGDAGCKSVKSLAYLQRAYRNIRMKITVL